MGMFLVLLALQATETGPIHLICGGAGSANKLDGASATYADNQGYSGSANILTHRRADFEDQVDVVIDGDSSKIRLPRIMLPPIHGGDAGWFKMAKVNITASAINGNASVNFMNSPKVHIDRRTGTISIDGKAGHYQGRCEKADEAQGTKF